MYWFLPCSPPGSVQAACLEAQRTPSKTVSPLFGRQPADGWASWSSSLSLHAPANLPSSLFLTCWKPVTTRLRVYLGPLPFFSLLLLLPHTNFAVVETFSI